MSELISGKEALIALANGSDVQVQCVGDTAWHNSTQWTAGELLAWNGKFRLKPRTITLNGVEIPAPFEPKEGEKYWTIDCDGDVGDCDWANDEIDLTRLRFIGVYRTKSEAEQVVAALRSVFNEGS